MLVTQGLKLSLCVIVFLPSLFYFVWGILYHIFILYITWKNEHFSVGGKKEIWQADRKILFNSSELLESFLQEERNHSEWGL